MKLKIVSIIYFYFINIGGNNITGGAMGGGFLYTGRAYSKKVSKFVSP